MGITFEYGNAGIQDDMRLYSASEIKEKTLEWVNQTRGLFGGAPLLGLPCGRRSLTSQCVIANCFSEFGHAMVSAAQLQVRTPRTSSVIWMPACAMRFVSIFDAGLFPELISKRNPRSEDKVEEPKPKEENDISDAKKFMEHLWVSPGPDKKIFIYPPLPRGSHENQVIAAAYS